MVKHSPRILASKERAATLRWLDHSQAALSAVAKSSHNQQFHKTLYCCCVACGSCAWQTENIGLQETVEFECSDPLIHHCVCVLQHQYLQQ